MHPIPELYVKNCKDNITNEDSFKELKTIDDFRQLPNIHNYLLDIHELITKGVAIDNYFKAMHNLYISQDDIKAYYGINQTFRKTIVACYILLYSSNNIITIN